MELLLMAEAGTVLQTVRKSPAQPAASRSMVGNPMVESPMCARSALPSGKVGLWSARPDLRSAMPDLMA
jgi:hypothetical protein